MPTSRPLLLATLFLFASCTVHVHMHMPPVGSLRHVVLFKFKDGTTPEQVRAIEEKFQGLPHLIPTIIDFEWGTDVSEENKADGFTHCFLVTFADAAGRDVYLPHSAHKEFVALAGPAFDKVLVIDYFRLR